MARIANPSSVGPVGPTAPAARGGCWGTCAGAEWDRWRLHPFINIRDVNVAPQDCQLVPSNLARVKVGGKVRWKVAIEMFVESGSEEQSEPAQIL